MVRAHFAIPDSRIVICGISFGLADAADPVNCFTTTRVSPSEAVAWLWSI